jgi:hypothetical protein
VAHACWVPRYSFSTWGFVFVRRGRCDQQLLRDDGGAGTVVEAVDGEVAAVGSEDFTDVVALGYAEEGTMYRAPTGV